jgi:hypothetical protein
LQFDERFADEFRMVRRGLRGEAVRRRYGATARK